MIWRRPLLSVKKLKNDARSGLRRTRLNGVLVQWVEFAIDYDSKCYQKTRLTVCVFLLKDLTLELLNNLRKL